MKAVLSSRKGVIMLSYSRGLYDVIGLGPSRPLHKWPPVKSAPGARHCHDKSSVCPSVCDVEVLWSHRLESKIMSYLISLDFLLFAEPNRNTPKFWPT